MTETSLKACLDHNALEGKILNCDAEAFHVAIMRQSERAEQTYHSGLWQTDLLKEKGQHRYDVNEKSHQ
jgi:hypothetical protein